MSTKKEAFNFLRSVEVYLNKTIPPPSIVAEELSSIVKKAKSSGKELHKAYPEGAFLNHYIAPAFFEFLKSQVGLNAKEAKKHFYLSPTEIFQNLRVVLLRVHNVIRSRKLLALGQGKLSNNGKEKGKVLQLSKVALIWRFVVHALTPSFLKASIFLKAISNLQRQLLRQIFIKLFSILGYLIYQKLLSILRGIMTMYVCLPMMQRKVGV